MARKPYFRAFDGWWYAQVRVGINGRCTLDSEDTIDNAIRYVEENPAREAQPRQHWSFVTPFGGIGPGWITYP